MDEYIDREKMLKYLEENNTDDEWIVGQYNADWIYSFIESQLTADVAEVRHGKWIDLHDEDVLYEQTYKCSVCGECFVLETGTPQENEYNYCPNCGAKMVK